MTRKLLPCLMLTALVIVACGTPPAQPAAERPGSAAASQGQALFALNCGECHGDDGSGTDEAPAVLGHTVEEVLKQVREPAGDMDAIPPDKLSDADLRLIAEYAAGLGGAEAHATDIEPTDELYEKMLESIKAGKAGNARHKLKELLGLAEEH